jgi:hypothetical protein
VSDALQLLHEKTLFAGNVVSRAAGAQRSRDGRHAQPADIIGAALFLGSDASAFC